MPVYRVSVNGENFFFAMDGKLGKHGFFTHRWVVAENADEAASMATNIVWHDLNQRLGTLVKNDSTDPLRLLLYGIIESSAVEMDRKCGFVWYAMDPEV
jgi:hypothetical protein